MKSETNHLSVVIVGIGYILAIPTSSTTPERTFSVAEVVTQGCHVSLPPGAVNVILFLKKNSKFQELQSSSPVSRLSPAAAHHQSSLLLDSSSACAATKTTVVFLNGLSADA